ncbi:MAG: phosphatidate cytidylyltransferase [Pseudomonadota bacterium]
MMATDRWSDLRTRILSAVILIAIGLAGLWAGGPFFVALVSVVCGVIVWEAAMLHAARYPLLLATLSGLGLATCTLLPALVIAPLMLALGCFAAAQTEAHKARFGLMVGWVLLGAFSMLLMRTGVGMNWIVWLIIVVVATDIAGYFAGRYLGGPKFWPAVSPKKTWSGTIAGWLIAGLVGIVMMPVLDWGWSLVPISVAVSFAGQLGDIAESALKRRIGVKDSSRLIPGHGGVFDRFDAMLGASTAAFGFKAFGLLPGLG